MKFPEAVKRLYDHVFVCKKCKTKRRAALGKIRLNKVACRRCGGKAFRPIKRGK